MREPRGHRRCTWQNRPRAHQQAAAAFLPGAFSNVFSSLLIKLSASPLLPPKIVSTQQLTWSFWNINWHVLLLCLILIRGSQCPEGRTQGCGLQGPVPPRHLVLSPLSSSWQVSLLSWPFWSFCLSSTSGTSHRPLLLFGMFFLPLFTRLTPLFYFILLFFHRAGHEDTMGAREKTSSHSPVLLLKSRKITGG